MERQYDQPGAGRHQADPRRLDEARMWPGSGHAPAGGSERPDPEEVRRWSHYFNLPWHQFQPQWAERSIARITLALIVGNLDFAFAPSAQGRSLVLREARYHLRGNVAAQDDPRDILNGMSLDIFLDQPGGRRPYKSHANSASPVYFLPAFEEFSQTYATGGITFAEASTRIPLLVVGSRNQRIVVRTNTIAIATGAPDARLILTGWEIQLPDDLESAKM